MATVLARRSVAVASLAALAMISSPMVGSSSAAPFAATGITTNPAPDSNKVVQAARPQIIASFSEDVAPGSTVSLVEKGTQTELCGRSKIKDKTVKCRPTAELVLGKTYQAIGHGKNGSGDSADTSVLEFTVNYPKLTSSYPVNNGAIVNGDEQLSATYDQEISETPGKSAFTVYEVLNDGTRGNAIPGDTGFDSSSGGPLGGTTDTITWQPAHTLGAGPYIADVFVIGVKDDGSDNPAAYSKTSLRFNVASAPPTGLTAPNFINNTNQDKAPFQGNGPAGTSITVTVHGTTTDITGTNPATATGTADVAPCDAVVSCPWTVEVDASSLDDGNLTWTAHATDEANESTAEANGPNVLKDTTAPPTPDATVSPMTAGSTMLTVSATDTGTDVFSYVLDIVDEDNHHQITELPSSGANLPSSQIDVTGLDDGTLSVNTSAVDNHGNVSSPDFDQVTKNTGITVDFPNGNFAIGDALVGFPTALADPIQSPSQVTLAFTEPITQSWRDNSSSPGGTGPQHSSTMCVARVGSSTCLNGSSTVAESNDRTLVSPLPNGLTSGDYTISYTVWPKHFCQDVPFGPGNTQDPKCVAANGTVKEPNSSTDFAFTVDASPPVVTLTSITPDPIKADDVKNVSVAGTVAADATSVQLTITSDGGKGTRLANATITPPGSPGSPANWAANDLDLSALSDGKLTVTATAKDAAGNSSTDTGTAKLQAHASHLTEKASKAKVTYGKAVTVSGRLTNPNGKPIKKADITVAPRYGGGDFGAAVDVKTDSTGHWSAILAPKHNATLFASYAGSDSAPVHEAAATHSARVKVKALVKITNPKGGSTGSSPTIHGKVRPNEQGETVRIYRTSSHGPVLVGKDTLDKKSGFAAKVDLPQGTVKIFAKVGKTALNLGGRSKIITLQVA